MKTDIPPLVSNLRDEFAMRAPPSAPGWWMVRSANERGLDIKECLYETVLEFECAWRFYWADTMLKVRGAP